MSFANVHDKCLLAGFSSFSNGKLVGMKPSINRGLHVGQQRASINSKFNQPASDARSIIQRRKSFLPPYEFTRREVPALFTWFTSCLSVMLFIQSFEQEVLQPRSSFKANFIWYRPCSVIDEKTPLWLSPCINLILASHVGPIRPCYV